jgi:murein DD-endopeptidase MepM/ murein hydrolase activator NlpD
MKTVFKILIILFIPLIIIWSNLSTTRENREDKDKAVSSVQENCRKICGTIQKGESLFDIFKRYKLNLEEFLNLKEASADIHSLKELYPGHSYKIIVDDKNQINSFKYWIDEDNILDIKRTESGFCANKVCIEYEKRIQHIGGLIKDNLISSMGEGIENVKLALLLSDVFAWDIDFNTDLRDGDKYKIVVEGLYLNGEFRKYGNILSAEFNNNGNVFHAYRFENNGKPDYYDADGNSLRKAFLKAPLNFRRISSYFSKRRFHPIFKIYRPHHGIDYAAPTGTPVSSVGEGRIVFSGYKGQYGKLVVIRHPKGFKTYYGHLSRIKKNIRSGLQVEQGQVIGFVGATGLATGPHLHYEMRSYNRPVNPLTVKIPRGKSIPKTLFSEFINYKNNMDKQLASINSSPYFVYKDNTNNKNE